MKEVFNVNGEKGMIKYRYEIGEQYGLLTIISLLEASPKQVHCQCQCGKYVSVYKSNLRSGRTRSCGCNMHRFRTKNIKGQRFGYLIPTLALDERDKEGITLWLCECICGQEIKVSARRLIRKYVTSCGCKRREKFEKREFGNLMVLSEEGRKEGIAYWSCQCRCGNKTVVSQQNLVSGHTKSCGCLKLEEHRTMAEGTCIDLIASKTLSKNNTSGHKGVSRTKRGKWVSNLTVGGKHHFLGSYHSLEEAVRAREAGEEKYFQPLVEKYKNRKG